MWPYCLVFYDVIKVAMPNYMAGSIRVWEIFDAVIIIIIIIILPILQTSRGHAVAEFV
jgi:hypothetical protein